MIRKKRNTQHSRKIFIYARTSNVSFLITRKGVSDNALKVIDGDLCESGKIIVPLNDNDLITMIRLKSGGELPEDYLFDKVDDMILSLSK